MREICVKVKNENGCKTALLKNLNILGCSDLHENCKLHGMSIKFLDSGHLSTALLKFLQNQ